MPFLARPSGGGSDSNPRARLPPLPVFKTGDLSWEIELPVQRLLCAWIVRPQRGSSSKRLVFVSAAHDLGTIDGMCAFVSVIAVLDLWSGASDVPWGLGTQTTAVDWRRGDLRVMWPGEPSGQ